MSTEKKQISKTRTEMPTQIAEERIHNFSEVALGYTEEMTLREAMRCLNCPKKNCIEGCPVQVPIPEFIALIKKQNYREAIRKIYDKNILPAICGRVCPQESQCEKFCTLGKVKGSEPVAIGRMERFLADWARENPEVEEEEITIEPNGIKVAIIGAGPAGLTCAGDLAKMGYDVTIFEAFHAAGGVLVYGIPEFRLPKAIVKYEVEKLKKLGVKIELNYVIGKILNLEDLQQQGFKAIFIGVGAGLPKFMPIPGMELIGVLSANEFLTRTNLMKAYKFPETDTMVEIGRHVAVIGGGNVAMDSARCALRLGAEKVMVIYRRSEEEMPARKEEYEHAKEEGIEFHFLRNPVRIIGDDNGHVKGVEVIIMELGEADASGRRKPVPQPDTEYCIDADIVIMAIGTDANPLLTKEVPNLNLSKEGYISVDENMQSSLPWVFAGGDITTGSATVISAMGAGRKAAQSIHEFLQNQSNS
jgi:glutamate synthase (NADPH/NADH) small chain